MTKKYQRPQMLEQKSKRQMTLSSHSGDTCAKLLLSSIYFRTVASIINIIRLLRFPKGETTRLYTPAESYTHYMVQHSGRSKLNVIFSELG